jgi:hypothetical protein
MNQPITLTSDDHLTAAQEGWDIFSVDGNDQELQIQKADEDDKFSSDDEAWQFIIAKAISGSNFHRKIIAFIKQSNPKEFDEFVKDAKIVDNSEDGKHNPWLLKFDSGEGVGFEDQEAANDALSLYREAVSLKTA